MRTSLMWSTRGNVAPPQNHATRRAQLVCAYVVCACDLACPDTLAPYSAEPSGRKKSVKRKSKARVAREGGGKWERKGDPLFRREKRGGEVSLSIWESDQFSSLHLAWASSLELTSEPALGTEQERERRHSTGKRMTPLPTLVVVCRSAVLCTMPRCHFRGQQGSPRSRRPASPQGGLLTPTRRPRNSSMNPGAISRRWSGGTAASGRRSQRRRRRKGLCWGR